MRKQATKKTADKSKRFAHPDAGDLREAFAIEKVSSTLTPNLRALRLAMTTSDLLLSMGIPANSVVSRALDITDAYCDQPVNITISYNLLYISQIRGLEDEPLTLIRPIPARDINNMSIQAVQKLIYEIRTKQLSLTEAETRMDKILSHPANYPPWLPTLANTAIAPTIVLMYSTDWRIITLTAVAAILVNSIVVSLGRRLITPFFRQAVASAFVTVMAAVCAWLASEQFDFFVGLDPTLIVVGGIFLLVSGLAIVGAVQDALEEYYITATARLLRVTMLTTGIVAGILIGIYLTQQLGIGINVSPNPLDLTAPHVQMLGAALAAAALALGTQTRPRAILWAGAIGGSSLAIYYAATNYGVAVIPATGVAAVYVGLIASLSARLWRTPSSGLIACGILPLVPGLALFTGLMQLANYPPGNPLFMHGVGTLFSTIGAALAIATGASLGSLLGRPLHRHLTQKRNLGPFTEYMRQQLHADNKAARFTSLFSKRLLRQDKNDSN